jgi:predicted DNA-binding protein with PD1-like motif
MEYAILSPRKSFLLRLIRGEDILLSLQEFCRHDPEISAGTIQGIGAVSKANVGFFDGQKYLEIVFTENLELLSLIGNIALEKGTPNQIIHVHGVFGRKDGSCVGGHILEGCTVSVTSEIQITINEPAVYREEDPDTKLKLLSLPHKI